MDFQQYQELHRQFARLTLSPWCKNWEQAIARTLLNEHERRTYYAEFSLDALLRGDQKTRFECYAIAITHGIVSPNEARGNRKLERETGRRYVPATAEHEPVADSFRWHSRQRHAFTRAGAAG